MEDRLAILLVEDDPDSASDYKEDIESLIDAIVTHVIPPPELYALAAMVSEYKASAVIVDELLQQRSDATYMGIDAFEYLRNAFPRLPVDILTNYPHGSELKGRRLPVENLIRKREFDEDEDYKKSYLQDLHQRMERYRQGQDERCELAAASDRVTEEFIESLVRLHFEADESIEQIAWIRSCGNERICLLEINRTALPSYEVQAFRFAPSKDVPFPMSIADIRPTEWEQVQSGDIPLPEGWTLAGARIFQRSEVVEGEVRDVG